MYWKLKVLEYGKVESAEIEMAPLTLFVGDNNSGKSYLMSLLWGIQNFGIETLLDNHGEKETEEEQVLMSWMRKQISDAWETGHKLAETKEAAGELQAVLDNGLDRNKDNLVERIFNNKSVKIRKLRIELKDLTEASFKIKKISGTGENGSLYFSNNDSFGFRLTFSDRQLVKINESFQRVIIYIAFSMILNIHISDVSTMGYNIYLPSSRTGFMLTKDLINRVGRNSVFNIEIEQEKVSPFSRPVNQFVDVLNDLTMDSRGDEKFDKVIEYLENGMTEGTVHMSGMPSKEISYVPAGGTEKMPLRIVSAVVTELTPLLLILKHKKYLNTLFYEEPEMCLHPQLQQKMARVICQLANRQLKMVITTHSDLILQHINNMVSLFRQKDREEICRQLGYTCEDFLREEQIKVYQLKSEYGGKTVVEEIECGENGFAVPAFNDALDENITAVRG